MVQINRRDFLAGAGAGILPGFDNEITGSLSSDVKKFEREPEYYGVVTETDSYFEVDYDYFPNPVLEKIGEKLKLKHKKPTSQWVRNQNAKIRINKEYHHPSKNISTKTSVFGFHKSFTETTNENVTTQKTLSEATFPKPIENKLLSALRFVQLHTYKKDYNSTSNSTYIRTPTETIIDGVGDCKDKTILFKALANGLGYEVGYAVFTNHVSPIIKKQTITKKTSSEPLSLEDQTVSIEGEEYLIIEPSKYSHIGESLENRENLILTYTNEFTTFNIEKIPNHVIQAIKITQK